MESRGKDTLYIFFSVLPVFSIICSESLPTVSLQNQLTPSSDCSSGRFLSLPLHARVTILTCQLTLRQRGCAERCIRRDNEEHASS